MKVFFFHRSLLCRLLIHSTRAMPCCCFLYTRNMTWRCHQHGGSFADRVAVSTNFDIRVRSGILRIRNVGADLSSSPEPSGLKDTIHQNKEGADVPPLKRSHKETQKASSGSQWHPPESLLIEPFPIALIQYHRYSPFGHIAPLLCQEKG